MSINAVQSNSSHVPTAPTNTIPAPAVQLLWIPLGANQRIVEMSGRIFETISALWQRRSKGDIYHAALVISAPEGRYTVEMAPIPDGLGTERGVVAEGPVGLQVLGRFRLFRYEIRRWLGGTIPDADRAVSCVTLSTDQADGRCLLDLLPGVPNAVWGRDELHTGEMWNSNSVVAWLLARGGFDMTELHPPPGGRAPGWEGGLAFAQRAITPVNEHV